MALILNIDTATENAGVCLSKDGEPLAQLENKDQKSHASFVQPAIQEIMIQSGYPLAMLDAIAVTAGPGSYTGLRVGLSSAKGLCFAMSKPLILINTLEVIAAAQLTSHIMTDAADSLLCPMIDARRMEVFTAVYDKSLQTIMSPAALVLDEHSFAEQLAYHKIIFCGNGSTKFQKLAIGSNALFSTVQHQAKDLAGLATQAFHAKRFADLAYSEPFYLKEFFTPVKPTLKGV